ncbi:MAG: hypothetical protein ROR55_15020 [Devosia sp.]
MNAASGTEVFLVPVIDVNWLVFAPFDPGRDFRIDPPNVEKSIGETRELGHIIAALTGGRAVLTPHSGTYCRTGYYEGAILEVYREWAERGGEVAVHLHEEIKGGGVRFGEEAHVREVFADCHRRLTAAGLVPTTYRGGHNAYAPFMNDVLTDHGISIDLSCCPTLNKPDREAVWINGGVTAYRLPDDPRAAPFTGTASPILEIPIGSDGEGADYCNFLQIEQSELDNHKRVWSVIRERAQRSGEAQVVHVLFHTGSMGRPEWVDRFKAFLRFVPTAGGAFVGANEAASVFADTARANAA